MNFWVAASPTFQRLGRLEQLPGDLHHSPGHQRVLSEARGRKHQPGGIDRAASIARHRSRDIDAIDPEPQPSPMPDGIEIPFICRFFR